MSAAKKTIEISENQKKAELIVEDLQKKFGEQSVTLWGKSNFHQLEIVSTGSLLLDQAIGAGGYARGKVIEIFGSPSSGKSTLALHAVKMFQQAGGIVVYFDLENGLDIKYAKSIGVNAEELLFPSPKCGEEVFDIVVELIKIKEEEKEDQRRKVDLIVIDSVSNLVPLSYLENSLEKQRIGSHAALISAGLRKLKPELINNKRTTIIFINQTRKNISTTGYFSSPKVTTGGGALTFDSDLRIELKKVGDVRNEEHRVVGIKVEAEVKKNKLGVHGGKANLEIIFPGGIQKTREVLDLAVEKKIIQKSGTWYSYEEKKLGQGKENAADYLQENPELYQKIEKKVLEAINTDMLEG